MIDSSLFLYLILASQSVLLGAAVIALARFQRRCRDIEAFWSSPTGAMLQDDNPEVSHNDDSQRIINVDTEQALLEKLKLDQRIADLQRRLKTLSEREPPSRMPVSFEIERNLPIENAQRMAKSGASVEELTRVCGLNVGEARLLRKLHGRQHYSIN
ncbi:MAG: DUF2802 domain-containing protein [Pseudomonadota bacterium]